MRSRCARGVRHVAAVPAVHAHRCCICAWHACARLSERALAAAVSTTGWCWWDLGLLSGGLGASDGSQMRIAIAHWVGWRFIPIIFREVVGSVRDVGSSARAWGVRNVCAHGGMRVMCVRGRRKISFTPPTSSEAQRGRSMMWQSQLSLRAARKCVCSRVRYVIYRLYYTILISQRLS